MDDEKNIALDLSLPKKDATHTERYLQRDSDVSSPEARSDTDTDDAVVTIEQEHYERGPSDNCEFDDIGPPCSKRQRCSSEAPLPESPEDAEDVSLSESGLVITEGGAICRTIDDVTVSLHDETLWHAFSDCGTEMIISRGGRRMFPHIVLSFAGLVPDNVYSITLEILPADDRRYKYINNQWMAMGMADPGPGVQPIVHPDSPNTGAYWTHHRASFSKVRLTNNKEASSECSDGNILLLSMHKYVAVIKVRDETVPGTKPRVFCFDETTFMAVTAYQNYKITHLKIKNNPFAKAFRDFRNASGNRTTASRRRDSASKLNSSHAKEAMSHRTLPIPHPAPSFGPVYFPFPGAIRPYRLDQPAMDPVRNPALLARMHYFPWMALGERMNSVWLKNQQSLFGLPQPGDLKTFGDCKDDDRGTGLNLDLKSPFPFLNGCRQLVTKTDDSGKAEFPSASN